MEIPLPSLRERSQPSLFPVFRCPGSLLARICQGLPAGPLKLCACGTPCRPGAHFPISHTRGGGSGKGNTCEDVCQHPACLLGSLGLTCVPGAGTLVTTRRSWRGGHTALPSGRRGCSGWRLRVLGGKERTPPSRERPARAEGAELHRKELRQGCRGLQAGVLCAPLRCTSQSWRQQRELDVACCKKGGEENRL